MYPFSSILTGYYLLFSLGLNCPLVVVASLRSDPVAGRNTAAVTCGLTDRSFLPVLLDDLVAELRIDTLMGRIADCSGKVWPVGLLNLNSILDFLYFHFSF